MKHELALTIVLFALFWPAWLSASEPETIEEQHLFKIERSKNANIVQYDVRLRPDGTLDPKKPVTGYWIRLAEDGRRMKLRFLEKRFVYGFKTKYDSESNTVKMVMKANFGREMKILETTHGYRAMIMIDGREALIEKIFVHASSKRLSKKVEYIELYGVDPVTCEDRYEKYVP